MVLLFATHFQISLLAFIGNGMGIMEMMLIGTVAVILFGKRLPEVARSMGKSYNQFRRGLGDLKSEVNMMDYTDPSPSSYASTYDVDKEIEPPRDVPTAPKFEPPFSEPKLVEKPEIT